MRTKKGVLKLKEKKIIYEENRIETKENTQIRNNIFAKTEKEGGKHSYQTNEEKRSCSNYKGKGKRSYRKEDKDLKKSKRRIIYQEGLKNRVYKDEKTIIVQDIPPHVTRTQIFKAVIHIGRVKNIEMIQEEQLKMRAEVMFEESRMNNQETEV